METLERKFTLQVPSSTENLALIREFVSSAARQAGFDEKEVGRLELAVDEACANVIETRLRTRREQGSHRPRQTRRKRIFD